MKNFHGLQTQLKIKHCKLKTQTSLKNSLTSFYHDVSVIFEKHRVNTTLHHVWSSVLVE